jgi:hypothetical protein
MSVVVMLMIGGWTTTICMFAFCALKESGKLLRIRRRMALWLDASVAAQRARADNFAGRTNEIAR